ncbi:hypothetical protein [Streptomyces specialis]|uniref:hypothetical protein n=1 Tax=Streptomyces specialis TaxID=498367 RepID=UPI00073EC8D9|nr:hypothetical protein [Streptomyces specialis]
MAKSVPVRCPACRREHTYVPPDYPCSCGAPVTVLLPRGSSPVPVRHRSWAETWTALDCPACGRSGQWPRPEFDCPCGVTLRLAPGGGSAEPAPPVETGGRVPFHPLIIRTAYDVVACATQFLRWLGFREVRISVPRPASGINVRGPSVVGLVNPTTEPTEAGEIETVWLHALAESVTPVAFSLAGYRRPARARADELTLPLFVLDLTGAPQPVNGPAEELLRNGPPAK